MALNNTNFKTAKKKPQKQQKHWTKYDLLNTFCAPKTR